MSLYDELHVPAACRVDKTIFKKLFYENASLSTQDRALFTDVVDKITWIYCLKPETINIKPYVDDTRNYVEVEVVEASLHEEKGIRRIAEIVMRSIPYPMVLVFRLGARVQLWLAQQRTSQNDEEYNTLEEMVSTPWLEANDPLFAAMDVRQMRFTNYFALYSDIIDAVSVYNAKAVVGADAKLSGEEARQLLAQAEELDRQIAALRVKLKKETQFNRKMELNVEIKGLENRKKGLGETL